MSDKEEELQGQIDALTGFLIVSLGYTFAGSKDVLEELLTRVEDTAQQAADSFSTPRKRGWDTMHAFLLHGLQAAIHKTEYRGH